MGHEPMLWLMGYGYSFVLDRHVYFVRNILTRGWLPRESGQCATGTAAPKPSPRESALAECAAALADAPQAKPQSQSMSPLPGFRAFRPGTGTGLGKPRMIAVAM